MKYIISDIDNSGELSAERVDGFVYLEMSFPGDPVNYNAEFRMSELRNLIKHLEID